MKKLLLITAIVILFISCSNDEQNCTYTCNAWVRQEGQIREVMPIELDCETNQPINLPQGYEFLGCDNDNTP